MTKCLRSIPSLTFALVGLSYSSPLEYVHAEDSNCFQTATCAAPIPHSLEQCLEEYQNKPLNIHRQANNVVVLSAHSSRIEQDNAHLSYPLNELGSWNRYDFSDHGVAIQVSAVCS